MSTKLRVGHHQCQCTPGDYDANIAKVVGGLEWAARERIDRRSFPESLITGFFRDEQKGRRHSWSLDGPELRAMLDRVRGFDTMFMVGLNERRGELLYNTVVLVQHGKLIGHYSKAFPEPYFAPGREFPVFTCKGVTFGIVICADGGFIEPARILALKGARLIMAPHYNYIRAEHLLSHFRTVRSDHTARAIENGVWFLRGNSVTDGYDKGVDLEGVGYGDSYLIDPTGEIAVRSQRHTECFIQAEIDFSTPPPHDTRSRRSAQALGEMMLRAAAEGSPA
jgi:predicted amidohydrolase